MLMQTFPRIVLMLLGLIFVSLPGCSDSPTVEIPEEGSVELLEAGDEPREVRRYAYEAGQTVRWKLSMKMDMGLKVNGQSPGPMNFPTTDMLVTATVLRVEPDGKATIAAEFTDVQVLDDGQLDSDVRAGYASAIASMPGLKMEQVVDARGFVLSATLDQPAGLDQAIAAELDKTTDSLNQLSMPLPEEPIGIGARWVQIEPMEENGLRIRQDTTYTLKAIDDGDVLELDVHVTQAAPRQTVNMDGQRITFTKFSTEGKGSSRFALGNPFNEATIGSKTVSRFQDPAGREKAEMNLSMNLVLKTLTDE